MESKKLPTYNVQKAGEAAVEFQLWQLGYLVSHVGQSHPGIDFSVGRHGSGKLIGVQVKSRNGADYPKGISGWFIPNPAKLIGDAIYVFVVILGHGSEPECYIMTGDQARPLSRVCRGRGGETIYRKSQGYRDNWKLFEELLTV